MIIECKSNIKGSGKNMDGIKWLFFDIGSTLADESEKPNYEVDSLLELVRKVFEICNCYMLQVMNQKYAI